MNPARQSMETGSGHRAGKFRPQQDRPPQRASDSHDLGQYANGAAAVLAAILLWLWGFGAQAGLAQTVTFNYFSAPTLVAHSGLSEELGEILLVADAGCGTAVDALCISVAGSLQITYTDMVIDNTAATGITVCETLSGITVCNAAGSFLTGGVSVGSTAQGGVVSLGIKAGANFAVGDQVTIAGVRARIDQTPLAVPGTTATALLTVAPVAASTFSPTANLIARSADPLSLFAVAETLVPCVVADSPAVLEIREDYPTAFVDHGDAAESTYPGAPANARPLFGATNNSQIKLFLEGLDPGISIQWPASVPATMGGGVLDLVSQTADGAEALYVFGTADQGQSDVIPEIFEVQLTSASFTFSGHDPILGNITVQGQLLPLPEPSTVRPRYNHPKEPTPGVPLLKLRRCNVTTGIVEVYALADGILWFGNLDFELDGPSPLSRSRVPDRLEGLLPGDYTMNYVSGGPGGATFIGFVQPQTQTLAAGQTKVFTFGFSGVAFAQLELRSTPASVCPAADTAVGAFELVNATEDLQIIPSNAQFTFTFSRLVVAPFVPSGPAVFTPPEVAGASVTFGLRNRVTLSPGEALTFSGAQLDLGGLGDSQAVTVQLTTMPSSVIQLPASQATLATTDISQCSSIPPAFTAAGVTNGASFETGISPGSIATLFGTNLSHISGIIQASTIPLPTDLAGSSLTVNGIAAPLFAVANVDGQEQINLQMPWELSQLASPAQVTLVVTRNGVSSPAVIVDLVPALPGIFTTDGTAGAILHGTDSGLVTPSNPALPGEVVVIFATGLGTVTSNPGTGNPALSSPLSETTAEPTVTIGGSPATVQFSGLAPGFVGLYQVNIEVPAFPNSGELLLDLDVVIDVGGMTSKPVKLAVQAMGGLAGP